MEVQPEADAYYIMSDLCRKEGDTARSDSLRQVALSMADGHYRLMILTRMWREKSAQGLHREANRLANELNALRDTLARRERTDSLREKQAAFDMATISDVRLNRASALARAAVWAAVAMAAALAVALLYIAARRRALAKVREEAREEMEAMLKTNTELKHDIESLTRAMTTLRNDSEDKEKLIANLRVQVCRKSKEASGLNHDSRSADDMKEFLNDFIDVFLSDKPIVAWGKKRLARFVSWCRTALEDADRTLEKQYGQLTDHNYLIVLLIHLNKTKEQICQVMGMSDSSYRKTISRLRERGA